MSGPSTVRSARRGRAAGLTVLLAAGASIALFSAAERAAFELPVDLTTADFDGDGIDDLAMAALNPGGDSHKVIVDYSSNLPPFESSTGFTYGFGAGMASGNLNDDDFDDLVVGCVACGDEPDPKPTVFILYGSAQGLQADNDFVDAHGTQIRVAIGELDGEEGRNIGSTRFGSSVWISFQLESGTWSQREVAVNPSATPQFGPYGAVAVGDVNKDGKDDLVVGTPTNDGGAITLFPGPVIEENQHTVLARPGLRQLGTALAVADLDGDGADDVIGGAPTSVVGGVSCGAVAVLRGASSGISADRMQVVHQSSTNVPGVCESGDLWGTAVAASTIDSDARPEVVVGAPGEDVGSARDAGAYTVLQPGVSGVTGTGALGITQNTPNVPSTVEAGDQFGRAIVLRDRNGDARPDVLVGAPGEDVSTTRDAGLVAITYSSVGGRPAAGSFYVSGRRYGEIRLGWNLG